MIRKYQTVIKRFVRYGIIGASGVGVNLGILTILRHIWPEAATLTYVIAVEASIISNYVLNAFFTFRSRLNLSSMWRYNVVSFGGLVLQTTIYRILLAQHFNYVVADLIAIPFGTILGFVLSIVWVFRAREGFSSNDQVNNPVAGTSASPPRRSAGRR
ncbi:MAG: GtrA family protein [Firmicutes bacterium]|jgi:dolichol-phosphate mannosyltransferase|nr:GtrA family protein [Bacillota bacterium]MCL5015467.1 GtrA family protein [Bacillota bacterium]